jgi:hypothetical protein
LLVGWSRSCLPSELRVPVGAYERLGYRRFTVLSCAKFVLANSWPRAAAFSNLRDAQSITVENPAIAHRGSIAEGSGLFELDARLRIGFAHRKPSSQLKQSSPIAGFNLHCRLAGRNRHWRVDLVEFDPIDYRRAVWIFRRSSQLITCSNEGAVFTLSRQKGVLRCSCYCQSPGQRAFLPTAPMRGLQMPSKGSRQL